MKLVVIIPAYNEEKTISQVIKEIPRNIPQIEKTEVLVINDGSTDNTKKVAKEAGADYIVSNLDNQGLALAFKRGLEEALKLGADIIVNIDADFQHDPLEIPNLIQPILKEEAEMVIGNRQIRKSNNMEPAKKYGNIILSWVLRMLLRNKISDVSCGFRAYSRECTLRLNIFSHHTYTHETIIQCSFNRMRIVEVPITFRKREGDKSRLIRSLWDYIKLAGATIIRVYFMYNPLKTSLKIGTLIGLTGLFFELRYLWFYFSGEGGRHLPSIILGTTLVIISVLIIIIGFLADLIDANRKREEEILYRLKKKDYGK